MRYDWVVEGNTRDERMRWDMVGEDVDKNIAPVGRANDAIYFVMWMHGRLEMVQRRVRMV